MPNPPPRPPPGRVKVSVELEEQDDAAIEAVIATSPIRASRSAAIRAILRRGAPLVLSDIAAGIPVAVKRIA